MKAKSWKKCLALTAMVSMISVMPSYAKADYYVDPAKPYDAPVRGMFHNQPVRSETVGGEYSVYIPETLQPWRPVVIVLPPDQVTAQEFAAGEIGQQWIGAANANQFALAFLQADGQWNLNNDQTRRDDAEYLRTVYTQLRSKTSEQDATFTTDKSHMSIIGYGQVGSPACEIAAEYPAIFCNLTMVDAAPAPAAVLNEVGERLSFPFPADSFNGQQELQLKNNKIPVPVWSIGASGDSAAVDYWKGVNQEAAEVRVTAEAAAPASIWADFMSRNGRFLGYAGGTLYPTEEFTANEDGSGYHFSEQMIDGYVRRWITYVPRTYLSAQAEAPLVVVSHGYSASMYALAEESHWADVADKYGFIVVFPQGYLNERVDGPFVPVPTWNSGLFQIGAPETDDVSFIRQVIDLTKANYKIDGSRVYGTGHSNGGSMTWLLSRKLTGTFAAIAPIGYMSAGEDTDDMSLLIPSWSFKGEFDGDGMDISEGTNNRNVLEFWKRWNGVAGAQEQVATEGLYTTYTYSDANQIPLVKYTAVKSTPHAYIPDESWMIWENFFSKYSRGADGTVYYEGAAVSPAQSH